MFTRPVISNANRHFAFADTFCYLVISNPFSGFYKLHIIDRYYTMLSREEETEGAMYMKAFQVVTDIWKIRKQANHYEFDLLALSTDENRFHFYFQSMLPEVSLKRMEGEHSYLLYFRADWNGKILYVNP